MISKAPDVDTYLREVSPERRPALEKLRSLILQTHPCCEEYIDYGMPCYKRNGPAEVAFASQKQYIALYVMKKDVVDEFRPRLTAASVGKGCIRFTRPEKMDFDVIAQLLRRCAESNSIPC